MHVCRLKLRSISTFVLRQKSYHLLVLACQRPNENRTSLAILSLLKEDLIITQTIYYQNHPQLFVFAFCSSFFFPECDFRFMRAGQSLAKSKIDLR